MADCIFCKILNGEISSDFLHEDETCKVFRDIHPKSKTHLLIVRRKHIPSIAEMVDEDESIVGHLMKCAQTIGEKLNLKAYNLQINVGKEAGQEIFHLHVHLMSNFS